MNPNNLILHPSIPVQTELYTCIDAAAIQAFSFRRVVSSFKNEILKYQLIYTPGPTSSKNTGNPHLPPTNKLASTNYSGSNFLAKNYDTAITFPKNISSSSSRIHSENLHEQSFLSFIEKNPIVIRV